MLQGVGAACILANTPAIISDAFPSRQRGFALGINSVASVAGSFIGLVLGGVLAAINWRLVFLLSVPVGLVGTIWAATQLREVPRHPETRIDWAGNITFALALISVMVGVTFGIRPYGGHAMGWTNPVVIGLLAAGVALMGVFVAIENRAKAPLFRLRLFRIRAYTVGTISTFLTGLGRGGMMFMTVIWLQGIWLPLHGYDFDRTPLWAGIHMLPISVGLLCFAPISGMLSDRFGVRPFAIVGALGAAGCFFAMELLPINFSYWLYGPVLFLTGASFGLFNSPNRAAVMNSLPASHRGAGGAMNQTFQNSAQVLSIGVFFTLMIAGLSAHLPQTLDAGLLAHGVPPAEAAHVAHLPPVSTLFASFLGINPIGNLLGPHVLAQVSSHNAAVLTSRGFFPQVISGPFRDGLHLALLTMIAAYLVAAFASFMRGGRFVYTEVPTPTLVGAEADEPVGVANVEPAAAPSG
jgi:MFS family permease